MQARRVSSSHEKVPTGHGRQDSFTDWKVPGSHKRNIAQILVDSSIIAKTRGMEFIIIFWSDCGPNYAFNTRANKWIFTRMSGQARSHARKRAVFAFCRFYHFLISHLDCDRATTKKGSKAQGPSTQMPGKTQHLCSPRTTASVERLQFFQRPRPPTLRTRVEVVSTGQTRVNLGKSRKE